MLVRAIRLNYIIITVSLVKWWKSLAAFAWNARELSLPPERESKGRELRGERAAGVHCALHHHQWTDECTQYGTGCGFGGGFRPAIYEKFNYLFHFLVVFYCCEGFKCSCLRSYELIWEIMSWQTYKETKAAKTKTWINWWLT